MVSSAAHTGECLSEAMTRTALKELHFTYYKYNTTPLQQ
jgi:hypothetical protein